MSIILQFLSKFDILTGVLVTTFVLLVYFAINRKRSTIRTESDNDSLSEKENWSTISNDNEETYRHVPLEFIRLSEKEMIAKSRDYYDKVNKRRSVRFFSKHPVPKETVKNVIKTAGTAPSGAHTQPWTFAVVTEKGMKGRIREIVEHEEELNYSRRMGDKWVKDVKKFSLNWIKPYIDQAPVLIIVLRQTYSTKPNGERQEHYYNEISTSISVGFLLSALQNAGLATVTTTPLNAGPSIRRLLNRPSNEKVLLLLPVGLPADDATVPDLKRKDLDQIMVYYD